MKKRLSERGRKISESKAIIKDAGIKFPIGFMVAEKYQPTSVGLVTSVPRIVRYWRDKKPPTAVVDVMWLVHNVHALHTSIPMIIDSIKVKKSSCKTK